MRKHAQLLAGLIFAFCIVWVPLTANAQQSEKTPRIGLLGSYSPTSPLYNEFRQGLRELGYIEGKNNIIEARYAQGNLDRLPELARARQRAVRFWGQSGSPTYAPSRQLLTYCGHSPERNPAVQRRPVA